MFLGLMFGLLFAFTINLKVYLPLIVIQFLVSYYGDSKMLRLLAKKLFYPSTKNPETRSEDGVRKEIFNYYFQNNYLLRGGITITILFAGLLTLNSNFNLGNITSLHIAYVITILGIIYNEMLVWRWRKIRRKNLMLIKKNLKDNKE